MKKACIQRAAHSVVAMAALLLSLMPSAGSGQDRVPVRIVSLAPNITREIHDLGSEHLLVGATSYTILSAASRIQVVGSPGRINIEKTFSLKPQLVLASTDCNSKSDIEALRKLGCTVHIFQGCESFECMCTAFEELAAMLGRSQQAGKILGDVRSQIEVIQTKVKSRKNMKIFWQLGENPLVSASDDTFSGELLIRAGCRNIFGKAPMHYPRVNAQEVIRLNPDVIVVVTQMGQPQGESAWERYTSLNAVKNRRVYEIPADLVCQPTPVMYLKGYKAIVALLHPGIP